MALKATIFKAELKIADMDRHYYADHALTVAQHPSENDARMMVRILTFVLHAAEDLQFGKGVSTEDEPDVWQKNLNDEVELWIDLGQPDEKRIRKACMRAKKVFVYTYNGRSAKVWWSQIQRKLDRFENLSVIEIPDDAVEAMARLAQRNMHLQYTVQESQIWLSNENDTVHFALVKHK